MREGRPHGYLGGSERGKTIISHNRTLGLLRFQEEFKVHILNYETIFENSAIMVQIVRIPSN